MTLFPVQLKPKSINLPPRFDKLNYAKEIIEVPNLITKSDAEILKTYANDTTASGLHRRGSKNMLIDASFYTCLVFRYSDPVYSILDHVWIDYARQIDPNIVFIEPYEVKIYVTGDKFDSHHDACGDPTTNMCRKINLVIQLTDPDEYVGGNLFVDGHECSREFGTGIFFPADAFHEVSPITDGTRVSLIGHSWGPYQK